MMPADQAAQLRIEYANQSHSLAAHSGFFESFALLRLPGFRSTSVSRQASPIFGHQCAG
jgi:hypothetical protein